jgi:hypothetical protein
MPLPRDLNQFVEKTHIVSHQIPSGKRECYFDEGQAEQSHWKQVKVFTRAIKKWRDHILQFCQIDLWF